MSLQSRNQCLACVIPNLDSPIVRSRENVWLVGLRVVVHVVHALGLMCLECEVGCSRSKVPNLDRPVQTCRGECVGVLWIDRKSHNIVAVSLEDLHALPALLPIPKLDRHVITGCQHEGLCWVYYDRANVVGVRLKGGNLLARVVVVDS